MYEITQKIIKMSLEEFKKYEIPKGWKLIYVSGYEKIPSVVMFDLTCTRAIGTVSNFEMSVTIEKEK